MSIKSTFFLKSSISSLYVPAPVVKKSVVASSWLEKVFSRHEKNASDASRIRLAGRDSVGSDCVAKSLMFLQCFVALLRSSGGSFLISIRSSRSFANRSIEFLILENTRDSFYFWVKRCSVAWL